MNIKFLVSISGSEYCYAPGQTAVIEQAEALRLINAGFAVPVEEPAEKAVIEPAEKRRKK